ncbi:hypothetical protein ACIBAG_31625 [Streptomyces sp. NPDC051243]|uniref:hypothetical protein n=1 Tax=Streptomyces sp. NPDC051243 TaxID=3365646 RepID=UPI0037AE5569
MKDFVDTARAANPNVEIVLANVPHRTTLGDANPHLPQRTTDYNKALAEAIPTWDTDDSPVVLADLDDALTSSLTTSSVMNDVSSSSQEASRSVASWRARATTAGSEGRSQVAT